MYVEVGFFLFCFFTNILNVNTEDFLKPPYHSPGLNIVLEDLSIKKTRGQSMCTQIEGVGVGDLLEGPQGTKPPEAGKFSAYL